MKKKFIIKNLFPFIIIRSFRNALEVVFHRFKSKKLEKNIKLLLDLFIIRFIFGLTYFRNQIKQKENKKKIFNKFSINNEGVNETLNSLFINGFAGEYKFAKEVSQRLGEEMITNCFNANILYKNGKTEIIENLKFNSLKEAKEKVDKNNIHIFKGEVKIESNSFLKKLMQTDYFNEIASCYLNNNKISINASIFISNPFDELGVNKDEVLKKAAQKYHFDVDYKKFFKLFIYFSDVKETNYGSHIFIPKTHINKSNRHQITRRFEDDEVEINYNKKREFLGESGTFFFVDTFGIHKGSPVKYNQRVAAYIEFGYSHFKLTNNTTYIKLKK